MNSTEIIARFREAVVDQQAPYLWEDAEVIGYLDDAQKMFCRLTGGLGDASTATVTRLDIVAGDVTARYHPAVLAIHGAYNVADGRPVEIINYRDLARRGLRLDGRSGSVRSLIVGMEPTRIRLYPVPSENVSIQLVVDRMPLVAITEADQDLEIDERHHVELVTWMKHRAYGKTDAETYDRTKSAESESRFRAYCEDARAEKERAAYKPRTVQYGGL